jgi:hypothetical protein
VSIISTDRNINNNKTFENISGVISIDDQNIVMNKITNSHTISMQYNKKRHESLYKAQSNANPTSSSSVLGNRKKMTREAYDIWKAEVVRKRRSQQEPGEFTILES